ncbi:hypothetical protein [Nocardioides gansuensis]|nr:hypothetical protein [Nocardioides gansuensis]
MPDAEDETASGPWAFCAVITHHVLPAAGTSEATATPSTAARR